MFETSSWCWSSRRGVAGRSMRVADIGRSRRSAARRSMWVAGVGRVVEV